VEYINNTDDRLFDNKGYTLLHEAALARRSYFLSVMRPKARTCLNAISCRRRETIDINALDNEGNTPLMVAMTNHFPSRERIIELLYSFDANPNLKNNLGQTARDIGIVTAEEEKQKLEREIERLDKRARGSFYVPGIADEREVEPVANSTTAPPEGPPISQRVMDQQIIEAKARDEDRRRRVALARRNPEPNSSLGPPEPPTRTRNSLPPLVVGGRKKTTRNNKGHTNVSRRWRRASHILRNSRVAKRKAGRRSTRRTRRWNTALVAQAV